MPNGSMERPKHIYIYLSRDDKQLLRQLAKNDRRTLGAEVSFLIEAEIQRRATRVPEIDPRMQQDLAH